MIQRNDIEENLKRGILEMLILKMLSQEDMYGYQMINEMNIRGKGLINIKEGSLYGPLYRLIAKNYISENKVLIWKRRTRVYYHLEPLGVEYLNTIVMYIDLSVPRRLAPVMYWWNGYSIVKDPQEVYLSPQVVGNDSVLRLAFFTFCFFVVFSSRHIFLLVILTTYNHIGDIFYWLICPRFLMFSKAKFYRLVSKDSLPFLLQLSTTRF